MAERVLVEMETAIGRLGSDIMGRRRIALRLAVGADRPAIVALQHLSLRTLGRWAYGEREIESYLRHVETLEPYLVEDSTYFVACAGGLIVGCGGWSLKPPAYSGVTSESLGAACGGIPKVRAMYVHPKVARLGIGSRVLDAIERAIAGAGHRVAALDATLSGVPLYRHRGYRAVGETSVRLPDGERLRFVCMQKRLPPAGAGRPR